MTTLHITTPVNDIEAWKVGYAEKADVRRKSGVRGEQVRRSTNGEKLVIVDLEFDSAREAESFLTYLEENIWKDNPVLTGTPTASVLESLAV